MPISPLAAAPPRIRIHLIGTPAMKKAAPKAMVIRMVWPTSGWISSSTTATP